MQRVDEDQAGPARDVQRPTAHLDAEEPGEPAQEDVDKPAGFLSEEDPTDGHGHGGHEKRHDRQEAREEPHLRVGPLIDPGEDGTDQDRDDARHAQHDYRVAGGLPESGGAKDIGERAYVGHPRWQEFAHEHRTEGIDHEQEHQDSCCAAGDLEQEACEPLRFLAARGLLHGDAGHHEPLAG